MTNPPTDDMREAFEAWAQSRGYDIAKEYGLYRRDNTTAAFDGYQAALSHQGEVDGWRPIDSAPEGVPCIVGWIDEDGDQSDFDIHDEGCWQEHENRRDHFLSVAPPGSRGPKEKAPYTHWMPLPPVPTSNLTALISKAEKV